MPNWLASAALRDVRVLLDGFEQLQIAMCFKIHD